LVNYSYKRAHNVIYINCFIFVVSSMFVRFSIFLVAKCYFIRLFHFVSQLKLMIVIWVVCTIDTSDCKKEKLKNNDDNNIKAKVICHLPSQTICQKPLNCYCCCFLFWFVVWARSCLKPNVCCSSNTQYL
jgi:hypothetical protein